MIVTRVRDSLLSSQLHNVLLHSRVNHHSFARDVRLTATFLSTVVDTIQGGPQIGQKACFTLHIFAHFDDILCWTLLLTLLLARYCFASGRLLSVVVVCRRL